MNDNTEADEQRIERSAIAYTGGYNEKTHDSYVSYVAGAKYERERLRAENHKLKEMNTQDNTAPEAKHTPEYDSNLEPSEFTQGSDGATFKYCLALEILHKEHMSYIHDREVAELRKENEHLTARIKMHDQYKEGYTHGFRAQEETIKRLTEALEAALKSLEWAYFYIPSSRENGPVFESMEKAIKVAKSALSGTKETE